MLARTHGRPASSAGARVGVPVRQVGWLASRVRRMDLAHGQQSIRAGQRGCAGVPLRRSTTMDRGATSTAAPAGYCWAAPPGSGWPGTLPDAVSISTSQPGP